MTVNKLKWVSSDEEKGVLFQNNHGEHSRVIKLNDRYYFLDWKIGRYYDRFSAECALIIKNSQDSADDFTQKLKSNFSETYKNLLENLNDNNKNISFNNKISNEAEIGEKENSDSNINLVETKHGSYSSIPNISWIKKYDDISKLSEVEQQELAKIISWMIKNSIDI